MPKRARSRKKSSTAKLRHNIIQFFNAVRRLGIRLQSWVREKAFPIFRKLPKTIWTLIGAIALILGLAFNLSLDLPELVSKYLITPTPLPFPKANIDENEVLVIITDFSGSDGVTASTRIFRNLVERTRTLNLNKVRIERLSGVVPLLSEDAQKIGVQFDATLVIWGTADGYGIEPRYEVVQNQESLTNLPNLGTTISTNPPEFNAYIVLGLPNEYEYLMLITLGQLAYYSDENLQAISLFSEAITTDLGNRASELNLGYVYEFRSRTYQRLDNIDAALSDINQAISLNPQEPSHFMHRGVLKGQSGDFDAFLNDLNNTINLDPKYPMAYVDRGLLYKITGQGDKALEDYQHAIELGEFDALYGYIYRGNYYASIGETKKAEDDYSSAIDLVSQEIFDDYNPYFRAEAWSSRGRFYINEQNYQQAVSDLTHAIEFEPHRLTHFNDRGVAYNGLGKLEEAVADYSHVIDTLPNNPNVTSTYINRGLSYESLGKYDLAISDFEQSIKLGNDEPNVYSRLGYMYLQVGMKHEALDALEKYLELSGDTAESQIIKDFENLRVELGSP